MNKERERKKVRIHGNKRSVMCQSFESMIIRLQIALIHRFVCLKNKGYKEIHTKFTR